MKFLLAIPLITAILVLASCQMHAKTAAKTPPAPAPPPQTAMAKPPGPPPPLSSPQTDVQLPPAQSISAEALASIETVHEDLPAPEPAPTTKPPVQARRPAPAPTPPPSNPPKPEQSTEAPAPQPPPATAPPEEAPRLQPVYPEEERRRVLGELERRKTEIDNLLRGLNPNRMSADQKAVVERIRSFQAVAEEAAKRGDFRSADAISERALILAKELASGR
jgi:hypothetical protein